MANKQEDILLTRKAYREQKNKEKLRHRSTRFKSDDEKKMPEFHFKNREKEYEPNKTRFYTRELRLSQEDIQAHLKKMAQEPAEDQEVETPNQNQEAEAVSSESRQRHAHSHRKRTQAEPVEEKMTSPFWGKDKTSRFLNIGIPILLIGIVILTLIALFV